MTDEIEAALTALEAAIAALQGAVEPDDATPVCATGRCETCGEPLDRTTSIASMWEYLVASGRRPTAYSDGPGERTTVSIRGRADYVWFDAQDLETALQMACEAIGGRE